MTSRTASSRRKVKKCWYSPETCRATPAVVDVEKVTCRQYSEQRNRSSDGCSASRALQKSSIRSALRVPPLAKTIDARLASFFGSSVPERGPEEQVNCRHEGLLRGVQSVPAYS